MSVSWVALMVVTLLAGLTLWGPSPVRAWLVHRRAKVLVISEFEPYLELLVGTLRRAGYRARGVHPSAALEVLRAGGYHIVVSGLVLPYLPGLELLGATRALSPCPRVILLTGEPTGASAGEAIRRGAFAVLDKRSMGHLRQAAGEACAQTFAVRRPAPQAIPVPVP